MDATPLYLMGCHTSLPCDLYPPYMHPLTYTHIHTNISDGVSHVVCCWTCMFVVLLSCWLVVT